MKQRLFNWRNNRNELISKKHKKVSTTLNYIENFLISTSAITGCVSVSAFASLVGIPIGELRVLQKHYKFVQ